MRHRVIFLVRENLTDRQREVFDLRIQGLSFAQIAERINAKNEAELTRQAIWERYQRALKAAEIITKVS